MTVWCHLPTNLYRRFLWLGLAIILLCVGLTTTLFFSHVSAAADINRTISFQGRLFDTDGNVVPDGYYNIQFKLYQDGTGTTEGNTGGSLEWTETYINNGGNNGVHVKNGYFSVKLGSITPFASLVDWNQDTLWLSMNIAGYDSACTSFDSAPCEADGEMLPMKRMTSTAYAMNAGSLSGKTADNFLQLAQGVQTDATTNSSIYVNKTNTGNLIQLQNTGADVFTVTNAGNIRLGHNADHTISVATSGSDTAGRQLTVSAGSGGSGSSSAGGELVLQGGAAGGSGNGTSSGPNAVDSEDYEGFSNGTTITTSNSTFTGMYTHASGSQTFSDEWSVAGTMSGKYTYSAFSTQSFSSTGTQALRMYLMMPSLPASTVAIAQTQLTGSTTAQVRLDSSGRPSLRNAFTNVASSSTSIPTDVPVRMEWKITNGSSTQQVSFYWGANLHGTSANITLNGLYNQGNSNSLDVGIISATSGFTLYIDEWAHGSDWIGALLIASGGNVKIDSGNGVGLGNDGTIAIGTANAGAIVIGGGSASLGQTIEIGASNMVGSSSNVTIGSGAQADTGTTTLQAKDNVSVLVGGESRASFTQDGVQIGDGGSSGTPSLLTLDAGTSDPSTSLVGSMYYNTTIGKVQCYEEDGWGACSAAPDTFVSITPTYAGMVSNNSGTGTLSTGFCSDTLNILDGSSAQASICGTNETYNFYKWTTARGTSQTRALYVSYKLPSTFSGFVSGTTKLKGKTDHANSVISYQLYRNSSAGLDDCDAAVSVSSGNQTTWQTGTASGNSDPAACGFQAGDSLLMRIDLATYNNQNAYISDITFAFSHE